MEFLSYIRPRYLSLDAARTCYCIDVCPLQVQVAAGADGPVLTDLAETLGPCQKLRRLEKKLRDIKNSCGTQKIVAGIFYPL